MSLTVSKHEMLGSFEYSWKFYFHEEKPAWVAFLKSGRSRVLLSTQCSSKFSVYMFL